MNEWRLLERIDRYNDTVERRCDLLESVLVESITNHIRKMLNVRRGSVIIRPDYGLADINDITSNYREAILVIRNSIQYCIDEFEPRLFNVTVEHVNSNDNPLELRFDISGDIVYGREFSKVWFETVMNSTGRVTINS